MVKRISITVILFLLIALSGYTAFNKQMTYCMLIGISPMEKLGHNIYLSPDAYDQQRELALRLVEISKARNITFWKDITSDPVFIFCSNWDDYYNYGMYRTQAMTRMNFAGEYIIVSPNGMNADDVSHEFCHAELYNRVGYFNDKKIPLWFHEGLAMMVCRDYPQTNKGYLDEWQRLTGNSPSILPLSRISSDKDFYSSPARSNLAYWRSGMEISRWLEKCGKDGLLELIERMNSGEEFLSAFTLLEDRTQEEK